MYLVLMKIVWMTVVTVEGFQTVVVSMASIGVVRVWRMVVLVGRQEEPVLQELVVVAWPPP